MSNLQNAETEPESLSIDAITERVMAAGIGARTVFALVDADDAELRFAVVDGSIPGGGYFEGFPLMPGRTYLIVPLETAPAGMVRGMYVPAKRRRAATPAETG